MEVVFRTAAQALEDERSRLKITTGSGDLDALIGGVERGRSYLFYGDSQEALDAIVHGVLVNSVLPVDRGGFGAKALYFNNCNYHQGKTILNPSLLWELAKKAGLEPRAAFRNMYAICAFNEQQQASASKEAADLLSRDGEIRLLVMHDLTRFLGTSRKPREAYLALREVVGPLWQVAYRNNITMIMTCEARETDVRYVPKPQGDAFLRHEASVIVYLKKVEKARGIRACLVKHPYKVTPDSMILHVSEGGMNLMGRMMPTFRQLLESQVEKLKRNFQNALLDLNHREAFDRLLREAWGAEGHAMSNTKTACVLDAMILMANVHNRKCVEQMRKKLRDREGKILELERRLEGLERRTKEGVVPVNGSAFDGDKWRRNSHVAEWKSVSGTVS